MKIIHNQEEITTDSTGQTPIDKLNDLLMQLDQLELMYKQARTRGEAQDIKVNIARCRVAIQKQERICASPSRSKKASKNS